MMTENEAKEAIQEHFNGNTSNVKQFLDAIKIAESIAGEMTLEQLEEWSKN